MRQEDIALVTGYTTKFLSDLEREGSRDRTPFTMVLKVVQALGGKITIEFPDIAEQEIPDA